MPRDVLTDQRQETPHNPMVLAFVIGLLFIAAMYGLFSWYSSTHKSTAAQPKTAPQGATTTATPRVAIAKGGWAYEPDPLISFLRKIRYT